MFAELGKPVTLTFPADEDAASYVWRREGVTIQNEHGETLIYTPQSMSDGGVFERSSVGTDPTIKHSVVLDVYRITGYTGMVEGVLKDEVPFTFDASDIKVQITQLGQLVPTYIWEKGSVEVARGTSFTIDDPGAEDAGKYVLRIVVISGEDQHQDLLGEYDMYNMTFDEDINITTGKPRPLPNNRGSFMYLGWWAYDVMRKNPDWKDKVVELPYTDALAKAKYGIDTYGECIMQESRNGYLIKATDMKRLGMK